MDRVAGQLVRRGMEAHATYSKSKGSDDQLPNLPAWGLALLFATTIAFFGLLSMIEYTYGHVIATLTMVESPSGVVFEPLNSSDPDATMDFDGKKDTAVEAEVLIVKQQPITAKLRTAVKHLRARAGFWSRFRGFSLYIVYGFLIAQFTSVVGSVPMVPRSVAAILGSVVFARLRMAWTHIVITEASPKPWFRRLPSIKLWKKIALPTALLAVCEQATIGIPVAFFYAMKLDKLDGDALSKMSCSERKLMAIKAVSILVLCAFTAVAIVVPAMVTLTRVQASLVSESDETIVPFDRSFGGRVVPEIVGGSGCVSMLDAWKTFDWNSRVRLLKLYVKVAVMQFATTILFVVAVYAQIRLIVGADGLEKGAALVHSTFVKN